MGENTGILKHSCQFVAITCELHIDFSVHFECIAVDGLIESQMVKLYVLNKLIIVNCKGLNFTKKVRLTMFTL